MHDDPTTPRGALLVGALLVAVAILAYLSTWNRSFVAMGLDGWFPLLADRWRAGETPYRDFFLPLPPLHLWEHAALAAVFGPSLSVARLFGTLARTLTAVLLFVWLARLYRPQIALVAAATTTIVFSADISDAVFFYNHNAVLWAIAAGLAASTAVGRSGRSARWFAAAAGFASGLCLLEKQTLGAALSIVLAVVLAVTLARRRELIGFACGWLVPILVTVTWLVRSDALRPFLEQVFFSGTAAKGPVAEVLLRPLLATTQFEWLLRPALIATATLLAVGLTELYRRRSPGTSRTLPTVFVAGAAVLAGVLLGARAYPRALRLEAIYVALLGSILGTWVIGRAFWRGERSDAARQRLLLGSVAAITAYSLSLSWPAWEPMVLPGLAFVICEVDRLAVRRAMAATGLVVLLCAVLVYDATADKRQHPYGWGEWAEPPVFAGRAAARDPRLAGLSLSATTARFLDGITELVRRHSRPSDSVFVFPNMPLIYWLSERRAATFSVNHWFDVAPDALCIAAAQTLRAVPPAVLVDYSLSEAEWRTNELVFRGGRPCGQRELHRALLDLAESPDYAKVAETPAPVTRSLVRVWVRRDRLAGEKQDE